VILPERIGRFVRRKSWDWKVCGEEIMKSWDWRVCEEEIMGLEGLWGGNHGIRGFVRRKSRDWRVWRVCEEEIMGLEGL
jgi:hypothetical protein